MENILEYLVPLVFILAFFNYRKKKKQRAAEKDAGKAVTKSDGLFGKLNKMMEENYEGDLKGAVARKKKSGTWADDQMEPGPVYREPEPWEEEDEVPMRAGSEQMRSSPVVAVSHPKLMEQEPSPVALPLPKVEPQRPEVRKEKPVAVKLKPKPATSSFNTTRKADLRQAIVWSEILAPPKALQDK